MRALAERVVQELLRTGVARQEAVGAALLGAWALLDGKGMAKVTRADR